MMSDFENNSRSDPFYQVMTVDSSGQVSPDPVNIKQGELLDLSGLSTWDVRMVDPSNTDSLPSMLLIREKAIMFSLGSLQVIATPKCAYLFAGESNEWEPLRSQLISRLENQDSHFPLEVIKAAITSVIKCLKVQFSDVKSEVELLNKVLPNQLSSSDLKKLWLYNQVLIKLASKGEGVRLAILDLLQNLPELYRICTLGHDVELSTEEKENIEILLEKYVRACLQCRRQIERALDSLKEIKETNDINLSKVGFNRQILTFSKVGFNRQILMFAVTLSTLFSCLLGMNYSTKQWEFKVATLCICIGGAVLFALLRWYYWFKKLL